MKLAILSRLALNHGSPSLNMSNIEQTENRPDRLKHDATAHRSPVPAVGTMQPLSIRKPRWGLWLVCAALLVLGGLWAVKNHSAAVTKNLAATAAKGPPPVPVGAGTVVQKDVPIYLDGLGTVQAYNAVTIRVRVDGQLKKVAFVEGQFVHVNDLLAEIDPDPYQAILEQAVAKKGQDEAQLNLQRVELKREAALLAAKIDSQDAYDQVAAQVKQLEAAVKSDQAAIDGAQVQLNYTKIFSPLDGLTGVRLVDQGNIVRATDSNGLVVVAQMRPISVLFTLPEQTLAQIHKQQGGSELAVLAVDRDNRKVLDQGTLTVIDNQIDATTGTIRLKATFPNKDLQLWPGQFVNARLLLTTRKAGLVVPESVIQRGPEGPYAFVLKGEKDNLTVVVQPVQVAQIEAGEALLDGGLQAGDRVVVDGQYRLQVGSHVKVRAATETPAQVDEEDF